MIGIGWRKRAFCKYFDSEENYTEFHKKAHRLLEAPTGAITRKLQDMIEDWLRNVLKETRASDWWRDYTGAFIIIAVPETAHIPSLPARQAATSQPLEVVGEKRPSRGGGRSASQPETSSKSKKARGA